MITKNFIITTILLTGTLLSINGGYTLAPTPNVRGAFNKLPIIETERLILCPLTSEQIDKHLNDFYAIFSDPEVAKYMPWNDIDHSVQQTRKRMETLLEKQKQGKAVPWTVILKSERHVIGRIGFYNWSKKNANAWLVVVAARDYWNKGLMSEALEAVLNHGFNEMGLNAVYAAVYSGNAASFKLLRKAKFKIVGTIPDYHYYRGAFWDRVFMYIRKDSFMKKYKKRI